MGELLTTESVKIEATLLMVKEAPPGSSAACAACAACVV